MCMLTYGPDGLTQTNFNLGEGKDARPGSARRKVRQGGFTDTAVPGNSVDAGQFDGGAHEVFQPKDGLADSLVYAVVTDFVRGPIWVELAGRGLFLQAYGWGGFGRRHANGEITN